MQGIGIVVGVVALLMFLMVQGDRGGFFQPSAQDSFGTSQNGYRSGGETISSAPDAVSNRELEEKIKDLYDDLDSLSDDLRDLKLREPVSPYGGMATLSRGNARDTDPEKEYLILRANRNNGAPLPISDWYLESYVTEKKAALPEGARTLETFHSTKDEKILLLPGEQAYIITGETPLRVSFHENTCTGYLRDEYDFYPSLSSSYCASPSDELADSSYVDLDDDSCYDFVDSLSRCEYLDEDEIEGADISRGCERFVEKAFNYNDCVLNHKNDPLFDDVGYWRVYLDRTKELWRDEREIIRLIDENDRVVDVLEY